MTNNMIKYKRKPKKKVEGIILDETFRLMPLDDHNVELQEFIDCEDKDGNPKKKWHWRSYHNSTENAIKAYRKFRTIRSKTSEELLNVIQDIDNKIDAFIKGKCNGKDHNCKCKSKGQKATTADSSEHI